jgi:RNA polymerase sigma-70 factor (ECF subfamily)
MHLTSQSLLERLRQPTDTEAWNRFVELYTPLLFYWARRVGLSPEDAADLVQEVFTVLLRKLPEFRYDRAGSFRSWLRTVTLNKWRERKRRACIQSGVSVPENDAEQADPHDDDFWEQQYRKELAARALEMMKAHFEESTWQACLQTVVHGRPAAEVGQELGLTTNAVYLARSRVLKRLREELDGFWE